MPSPERVAKSSGSPRADGAPGEVVRLLKLRDAGGVGCDGVVAPAIGDACRVVQNPVDELDQIAIAGIRAESGFSSGERPVRSSLSTKSPRLLYTARDLLRDCRDPRRCLA